MLGRSRKKYFLGSLVFYISLVLFFGSLFYNKDILINKGYILLCILLTGYNIFYNFTFTRKKNLVMPSLIIAISCYVSYNNLSNLYKYNTDFLKKPLDVVIYNFFYLDSINYNKYIFILSICLVSITFFSVIALLFNMYFRLYDGDNTSPKLDKSHSLKPKNITYYTNTYEDNGLKIIKVSFNKS